MINQLKTSVVNNLKNIVGFRTYRKIIVFSVDDYGNIRVGSNKDQMKLKKYGLYGKWSTRFDNFDTLETADDLSLLFETLSSVKDNTGRAAVFTPFANCANIDFEAIRANGYDTYRYISLPSVLNSSTNHQGAWKLWKEGIDNRLFVPQFHGREHLNVKLFNKLLANKDERMRICIDNNSYTNIELTHSKTIKYNEAFSFESYNENETLKEILKDGLNLFETVFGYKARNFNAPGAHEHSNLELTMKECGIKYIDTSTIKREHQGDGLYKSKLRFMGKRNSIGQIYLLRNCVFEPTLLEPEEAVIRCLNEIESAFRWNKPANISSHRVNFCGLIDEKNREKGIFYLKKLLIAIVTKWPDVEFFTSEELGKLIENGNG